MRLDVLNTGHKLRHKLLFKMIRLISGHPAPDVVKLLMYRGEFFGTPMNEVFQETMRGPAEWAIAEREMMASYISKTNECEF
ncbi:MAG: hypothetical protein ABI591_21350 [Kofleriaceae bacterium]